MSEKVIIICGRFSPIEQRKQQLERQLSKMARGGTMSKCEIVQSE